MISSFLLGVIGLYILITLHYLLLKCYTVNSYFILVFVNGGKMDFILEIVFEFLIEGGVDVASNKKISKFIRYPLIIIFSCLYLCIIFLLFSLGIFVYRSNSLASLIIILLDFTLIVFSVKKFKEWRYSVSKSKNLNSDDTNLSEK